jgi:hypothetical protein
MVDVASFMPKKVNESLFVKIHLNSALKCPDPSNTINLSGAESINSSGIFITFKQSFHFIC